MKVFAIFSIPIRKKTVDNLFGGYTDSQPYEYRKKCYALLIRDSMRVGDYKEFGSLNIEYCKNRCCSCKTAFAPDSSSEEECSETTVDAGYPIAAAARSWRIAHGCATDYDLNPE